MKKALFTLALMLATITAGTAADAPRTAEIAELWAKEAEDLAGLTVRANSNAQTAAARATEAAESVLAAKIAETAMFAEEAAEWAVFAKKAAELAADAAQTAEAELASLAEVAFTSAGGYEAFKAAEAAAAQAVGWSVWAEENAEAAAKWAAAAKLANARAEVKANEQ